MNADTVAAVAAVAVSVATALGTLYRGVRRRERDQGAAPFLAGKVAIEEAETALAWKDRRIRELAESEATLKTDLAAAVATSAAQQEQLTRLQARLYQVETENRDLLAHKADSEQRDRASRERISALETTVDDLKRKLALGGPTY